MALKRVLQLMSQNLDRIYCGLACCSWWLLHFSHHKMGKWCLDCIYRCIPVFLSNNPGVPQGIEVIVSPGCLLNLLFRRCFPWFQWHLLAADRTCLAFSFSYLFVKIQTRQATEHNLWGMHTLSIHPILLGQLHYSMRCASFRILILHGRKGCFAQALAWGSYILCLLLGVMYILYIKLNHICLHLV